MAPALLAPLGPARNWSSIAPSLHSVCWCWPPAYCCGGSCPPSFRLRDRVILAVRDMELPNQRTTWTMKKAAGTHRHIDAYRRLLFITWLGAAAACHAGPAKDPSWNAHAPLQLSGSCGEPIPRPAVGQARRARTRVGTKTPLFVFDQHGRLYRAGFDQRPWKLISDHGFAMGVHPSISADGRWVTYYGEIPGSRAEQFWLYDTNAGLDRLLLELPLGHGGAPQFSPNGELLAISSLHESRTPQSPKDGLYVVETTSAKVKHFVATSPYVGLVGGSLLAWSPDGESLFWHINDTGQFFEFSPALPRISTISGRYDDRVYAWEFMRDEKIVRLTESPELPSSLRRARHQVSSPDGKGMAEVDTHHVLYVHLEGADRRAVAIGRSGPCGGVTIAIQGWLDGHRYLVYNLGEAAYVYATSTGKQTRLFLDDEEADSYFWHAGAGRW